MFVHGKQDNVLANFVTSVILFSSEKWMRIRHMVVSIRRTLLQATSNKQYNMSRLIDISPNSIYLPWSHHQLYNQSIWVIARPLITLVFSYLDEEMFISCATSSHTLQVCNNFRQIMWFCKYQPMFDIDSVDGFMDIAQNIHTSIANTTSNDRSQAPVANIALTFQYTLDNVYTCC